MTDEQDLQTKALEHTTARLVEYLCEGNTKEDLAKQLIQVLEVRHLLDEILLQQCNKYVSLVSGDPIADTEREVKERTNTTEVWLIHVEPPTDPEEQPTYIFALYDEVLDESEETEYLHDHFTLTDLPNYHIEDLS